MKIVLASSYVPFVRGGGRFIVEWLETKLLEYGHQVERFYLPYVETQHDMLAQIAAYRLMDLADSCDLLVTFRPPSYVLRHPNKVIWFIHHIRIYYDLWNTSYAAVPDTVANRSFRRTLFDLDTNAILESNKVFANSKVVAQRLREFNGIESTVLYPPILNPSRFYSSHYGDEILAICRIEPHKRQWLLIEAMRHVRTNVRLRICGVGSTPAHAAQLKAMVARYGVQERVVIEDRWISEEEKSEYLATALAIAYLPSDEDSYGYPSLEAAHSRKCIITTTDSGGVLELVENDRNGLIVPPDPAALAEAMDRLYRDRGLASRMGEFSHRRISELRIDWPHVVDALTS